LNNIEVALQEAPSTPSSSVDLSGELERLASVHERGVISGDEFAQAKAKLLAG
jgi:hypothetical protein